MVVLHTYILVLILLVGSSLGLLVPKALPTRPMGEVAPQAVGLRVIGATQRLIKELRLYSMAGQDTNDDEDVEEEEGDGEVDDVEQETEEELDLMLEALPEEDDEDEDDNALELMEAQELTWTKRRAMRRVEVMASGTADGVARKLTWEEKYDEDPLRSEEPTVDYNPEPPAFSKEYVAMGFVEGDEQLSARTTHWVDHMQWARRSVLVPELHEAQVAWEHTLLSPDCMTPVGQVVGLLADTAHGALELLRSEPLSAAGGVSEWQLYRAHGDDGHNVTWPMSESQLFVGTVDADASIQERFNAIQQHSQDYYGRHEGLVSSLIRLTPVTDDDDEHGGDEGTHRATLLDDIPSMDTAGVLLVFNAKTNAAAARFIAKEPAVEAGLFNQWMVAPINTQDVSGQNHLMARTFGERAVLDQVHYMDPEDLLFEEAAGSAAGTLNKQALEYMAQAGRSFRYDRLDIDQRYRSEISQEDVERYNESMETASTVRLQPVVEGEGEESKKAAKAAKTCTEE